MTNWPKESIRKLLDAHLPWNEIKVMISEPKDSDRFDKYVAILQDRVAWPETILLPLSEHLYIVQKGSDRIVKCDCGHEFCDYRENWKMEAVVYARRTQEDLAEIGIPHLMSDPGWCELREFYCPGCAAQLDVEAVTPGYPILFRFKPDLEAFYNEWLGRPLPGHGTT
jgi:acetone carboxylase, gamma subunit